MKRITRRHLLQRLATVPLALGFPTSLFSNETPEPVTTTEFDISSYNKMLLPREHGQIYTQSYSILRRYPSREHCMQMAAFFNEKNGLIVIGNDPTAAVADWHIRPGDKLILKQYGHPTKPFSATIAPTLDAAASVYREWCKKQFWTKPKKPRRPPIDFMIVASSSSAEADASHINMTEGSVKGRLGAWFTQWRRFPFDRYYPDYIPKQPHQFAELLYALKKRNIVTFPYINCLLWDYELASFRDDGEKIAIRTNKGDMSFYNQKLRNLMYACPASERWQNIVLDSRMKIVDSKGDISSGIYLDMLAAAPPQLCWSNSHDHSPGDPYCWQAGLKKVLERTPGHIMVEGCAEVYMHLADIFLMHLYTDRSDCVPLWNAVYGDSIQTMGWKLKKGISPSEFHHAASAAKDFGVKSLASPWMTTEPEQKVLPRVLQTAPMPPHILN